MRQRATGPAGLDPVAEGVTAHEKNSHLVVTAGGTRGLESPRRGSPGRASEPGTDDVSSGGPWQSLRPAPALAEGRSPHVLTLRARGRTDMVERDLKSEGQ